MRKFTEPSLRNLLRKPLILGVPFAGLLALSGISLSLFVLIGNSVAGNGIALGVGFAGYFALRVFQRFAKPDWDEVLIFWLERILKREPHDGGMTGDGLPWAVSMPDTLTESELLNIKDEILERVVGIKPGERQCLALSIGVDGAKLVERVLAGTYEHVYTLYRLPVVTDPLWLFGIIKKLPPGSTVFVQICGLEQNAVRRRIEHSRRLNANTGEGLRDIDSEVTFQESSAVLEGISRGDETVVEMSLVVTAQSPCDLDPALFCEEQGLRKELALLSVTGQRPRTFCGHEVRAVTACDLIPNVADPQEAGPAILKTRRGNALYFDPQDSRLEALHWLVAGASGSGKSFFTGLVLKRMLDEGSPMSVLFVDHNRSFRRLVQSMGGPYLEPSLEVEADKGAVGLFDTWNRPGSVSGIELSNLPLSQRKIAVQTILTRIDTFLRLRPSTHPFYLVLDECWSLMRENPMLVQMCFREFRKQNAGVIAITQSLQDFISDESGQSIFQNAPIRILLRQGEDVSRFQGILGLSPVEAAHLARLGQKKGEYSECLIKTPFLSRLGRLYPTLKEHDLLRTDNLREEFVAETRAKRMSPVVLGRAP